MRIGIGMLRAGAIVGEDRQRELIEQAAAAQGVAIVQYFSDDEMPEVWAAQDELMPVFAYCHSEDSVIVHQAS